MNNDFTRSKYS